MVKISLLGTHDVGKTIEYFNLCYLLKKADKNTSLVEEISRICPLPINE